MAASTLDSDLFILQDNWPGDAMVAHSISAIGDSEMKNNLAAAGFNLGTKVLSYNAGTTGQKGYATLAYLQNHATINTMAAKDVCTQGSATIWYQVSNDPDTCLAKTTAGTGLAAVCLAVTTASYYCWFWVGGVCPEDYLTSAVIGGNYITDGNVASGQGMTALDCVDTDDMGFGVVAAANACCGHAIAADAA